ncbi:VWA domain-containing protein [Luteimonas marina]|uniref:VWA domain-containing protein n=1 Tax=Luteimonas marina TaxID=488485 RepID=A0A5C5U4E1_9GAMM|nr:VWA domain-containing protein [Luteimonas marina]TWT21301.1 VWA domain-containing protein [Luteimonas marina]
MQRHALASALFAAIVLSACTSAPSEREAQAASTVHDRVSPPAPPPPAEPQILDTLGGAAPAKALAAARMRAQETRMAYAPAPATIAYDMAAPPPAYTQPANTENYAERSDNPVQRVAEQPVSTFSIDVDTGSYSNVRRMIRQGVRPPADAVRAEEFINYFDYGHPGPASLDTPFRATVEVAPAPWNAQRHLLMVGIKGFDVAKAELPPANLVFLLDTSGSMNSPDKLPLLKQAFSELTQQLRAQDRVSIVVYAGSAGLVLPPTPGDRKDEILAALNRLEAGGSTNGGDGIRLAYAMAKRAFVKDGVNRVILATDGDFNVGTVDGGSLETMVADQRKSGIALTTLGFGTGNYNDHLAERLADAGDGNHAYIDTLQEARKVLVEEMSSTLLTIAQDVKIQVEFNPALVSEYRLIGYENRMLAREDFANDRVDAGDIGAGHEVTALYEITLAGSGAQRLPPLRYGTAQAPDARTPDELAHLRLRYKRPGESTSRLIETPVLRSAIARQPGESMRFAATVAAWADALRGGKHLEQWDLSAIAAGARATRGSDPWKLRAEFAELIEASRTLVADGESVDEPQLSSISR